MFSHASLETQLWTKRAGCRPLFCRSRLTSELASGPLLAACRRTGRVFSVAFAHRTSARPRQPESPAGLVTRGATIAKRGKSVSAPAVTRRTHAPLATSGDTWRSRSHRPDASRRPRWLRSGPRSARPFRAKIFAKYANNERRPEMDTSSGGGGVGSAPAASTSLLLGG
jgi:hypothetical protein